MTEPTSWSNSLFVLRLPEIITAIGVVVTAVGSILAAYWSYKSRQQSVSNAAEVQQIKTMVRKV